MRIKLCLCGETCSIHSWKYIRFFARRGHEVHVIAVCPPEPAAIDGVRYHFIRRLPNARGIHKIASYLLLALQYIARIRSIRPDVVNVMFLTDFGFFAALSRQRPLVITPWGSDVLRHPHQKRFWKLASIYALRHCDLVFCNSETMKRALVNTFGVPERRIRKLIWNGVDLDLFSPGKSAGLRRELGLEGKTVLFSNRSLNPLYRVDRIVTMFARLKQQVADAVLLIAGDGPAKPGLERLGARLGISTDVRFLGFVPLDQMRDYLRTADLYISVPESDSCATSVLEAMACGATTVASDIAANREWIRHAQNGWLVDPLDQPGFTATCLQALREPLNPEVIQANRKRIETEADFETNMQAVETAFRQMTTTMPRSSVGSPTDIDASRNEFEA